MAQVHHRPLLDAVAYARAGFCPESGRGLKTRFVEHPLSKSPALGTVGTLGLEESHVGLSSFIYNNNTVKVK